MSTKRFAKPPLSVEDKEKKAEDFVNMMPVTKSRHIPDESLETKRTTSKDSTVNYSLRLPQKLYDDIKELSNLTSLSINSICIEILRVGAKEKLKEFIE